MFTLKYRSFEMDAKQDSCGPTHWVQKEQLHGPFPFVSQEWANGLPVVYAHRDDGNLGMTFGPVLTPDSLGVDPPRPVLFVMNENGATVSKYDL